jgi:Na+/melibiose symporter-like transporter
METPSPETAGMTPPAPAPTVEGRHINQNMRRFALLISLGWLGTNLGLAITELPLTYLLKDDMRLSAGAVATFFAIGNFSNYIKVFAGILTDSVPLFKTRRRHYLLLSLLGTGILWLLLAVVPRTYLSLLVTYTVMYFTVMITSTTLGGVMVEAANRFKAEGRMTAQRIAMFRLGALAGGPIGGFLSKGPFLYATAICSACHLLLVPLFYKYLPEPPTARVNREAWDAALMQLRALVRNGTLLGAAGMVFLLAASPGFGTPLLYYQADVLSFEKPFVGVLKLVEAGTGLLAAMMYYSACRTLGLRYILAGSIVVHAVGTLFFLGYHDHLSAGLIHAVAGVTGTLAMLPIYDLAARATPRGSEALGYALMMSVWNLTNAFSNVTGSWIYTTFHWSFIQLVWLNAGTTLLVLLAVPLMPKVLMNRKDGAQD